MNALLTTHMRGVGTRVGEPFVARRTLKYSIIIKHCILIIVGSFMINLSNQIILVLYHYQYIYKNESPVCLFTLAVSARVMHLRVLAVCFAADASPEAFINSWKRRLPPVNS